MIITDENKLQPSAEWLEARTNAAQKHENRREQMRQRREHIRQLRENARQIDLDQLDLNPQPQVRQLVTIIRWLKAEIDELVDEDANANFI